MRRFIRHPSDIPIEYHAHAVSSRDRREHLNNVSQGGLSFSSKAALPVGTTITIRISHLQPKFEARGQVAWCRSEQELFEIGVAFHDAGARFRVRMVEQVCHIEHYKAQVLAKEGRRLNGEQAAREWIQKFASDFPQLEDDKTQ